jgi:hypothetical protein
VAKLRQTKSPSRNQSPIRLAAHRVPGILPPNLASIEQRALVAARDEFHLAAPAQNLRKLAKLIPGPQAIPAT